MYSKYIVLIDNNEKLPNRDVLIEQAWGELPISFVQDFENLNEASYLDIKVNKWEMNNKWSAEQKEEPWIRIEILRGETLVSFISENKLPFSIEQNGFFIMMFELDEGGIDVDYYLIGNLVKIFASTHSCYAYDGSYKDISKSECLDSFPTKEMLYEKIAYLR